MSAPRRTYQKQLIQKLIPELDHPNADTLYQKLHELDPRISKTTLYRNLHRLAQERKILEIAVPGGAAHYDFRAVPHAHTVCRRCGRVFDVPVDNEALCRDWLAAAPQDRGFTVDGISVMYTGLCPDCAAAADHGSESGKVKN